MIDQSQLAQSIQETMDLLDASVDSALYAYLASLMDEDGNVSESAMDIIQEIRDHFHPVPAPAQELIVELLVLEIQSGNADAMNDLGAMYYDGDGVKQDFTKAVSLYTMAAANGSRQAQENLGYCYYYGRNVPVDYKKAFHYFALGAFDGHLNSLYKIGDMYLNGYYVTKNEEEAFHIYERCLETMTDQAAKFIAGPVYLRLGNAFLYGKGTEKNAENALVCYQKAEFFLYDMVKDGDVKYKKSLASAISGQEKARKILLDALSSTEWPFD